jgi:radical SAM protein with 4Fe4S-binding SPASM domain
MNHTVGPWRITFDTNPDDCNLRCIMCEDHSPYSSTQADRIAAGIPKRRMDINLLKRILSEAQGSPLREIIPSTMGEPLIYAHFEDIITECETQGLKLNLTTNGTFPRKGVEVWAKRLVPITSDIKISWNGATQATQEKIMLGSQWENTLANIKKLIQIRDEMFKTHAHYCQITLQLTFLETNLHELTDIVKLGIQLGVDRIKGHHLWAHFAEIQNLSLRKDKSSILRWNHAVLQAQAIAAQQPLPNGKYIQLENIAVLGENAVHNLNPNGACPFLGKEAWIAADGRFNPCCAPDKERRQLGEFGNLNQKTLSEIWNSPEYQTLCKNYMQHAICQRCNMRNTKEPL